MVALYGCGGGGSKTTSPSGSTINATYSKGPVSGASAILLDASGNTVSGPVTTVDGKATFSDVIFSGAVYARFSGGSYTDEATGISVTLDNSFVMRSGVITNSANAGTLQLTATPLTEIGFQRAEGAAGSVPINLSNVNAFINEVADEFGLDSINLVEISPTPIEAISGTSSSDQYGVVLAAISQQELTAGNTNPSSTTLSSFITASVTDVDQRAFSNALSDLQTNVNTSSFITNTTTSIIIANSGIIDSVSGVWDQSNWDDGSTFQE